MLMMLARPGPTLQHMVQTKQLDSDERAALLPRGFAGEPMYIQASIVGFERSVRSFGWETSP